MSNNWEIKRLGEVCTILNGGTPKTDVKEYWDGNVKWITPKDMGKLTSKFVDDTPRKITSLGLQKSSAKLIPSNSLILSTRAPIGHLSINTSEMATNQGCRGIIPLNDINVQYLYYFLSNSIELLNSLGTGVTFRELSTKALSSVKIPLPPIPEQKRIVKILDEAFVAIDKAKANAEKNLQNSRELFDSYLNKVFANPGEDWEEKKLNQISENLDRKRIPITKSKRIKGKYPYYGASGIVDYVNDYIFDEDLLLISEDGANLLARSTPIAFSVSGKIWVNNHAHILRFDNITTQKYVEMYFASIKLDEYITGAAQPKLNQSALNSIRIPAPPIDKQKRIIENLNNLSNQTKNLEKVYQQKLADLEELKKSILQKAFEGQLTRES